MSKLVPSRWSAGRALLVLVVLTAPRLASAQAPPPVEEAPVEGAPDDDPAFEVTVEAPHDDATETHASAELAGQALEREAGQDLAEAIGDVPGVTVGRGSSDATKPIIRGQVEKRLLVLFDGVRHASQKWGADHATEIDPFAAGSIGVIKGAAGVRYGPDAIGGVVLVDPLPLRSGPGVDGSAQLVGGLNGRRGVGALRLDAAPSEALAFRVEGNYGRSASLETPDYVLGNTASASWNLGATARYARGLTTWSVTWHRYDLRAGVCWAVRAHAIDDFLAQARADAPLGSRRWEVSYAIDRPSQAVTHDVANTRVVTALPGGGSLRATYAFQLNHREEYERTREAITGPQYDFVLRTHSLDVDWTHGAATLGGHALDGGLGLSGAFQENVYAGLPLIPNHRSGSVGVYALEGLTLPRVHVEAGARYDHQGRTSYLSESAFEGHLARDTLGRSDCAVADGVAQCGRSFDAGSVSAGALWHVVPDHVDAKLDLSSASRFPNGDELYLNGAAPTSPVYALGDPSLGVETTWSASPTVGLVLGWVQAEVSGFANLVRDFIQFAPEIGPDGEPAFDVTIRGAYPRFTYTALDARFYGADGGVTFGPEAPVSLALSGAVVRGDDVDTGDPLLFVPPDRARAALRVSPPDVGAARDAFVEVSGEAIARQTRYVPGTDLVPPPDGALLLGAAAGVDVGLRGDRALKVGVEGSNLTNTRYREATSLLRYFADEPGRDLRLRLGLDF